jgi:2'-5' RNA ligase
MVQQPGLFGLDTPAPTDRLFLGLFPDPTTAARIAALGDDVCRRHGLRVPRHQVERLHVTLFHIGDWAGLPAATVETAIDAAAVLHTAPFDVRFDKVVSFSGNPQRRPLVLKAGPGNETLHTFREQLGRELLKVGLGRCVTRTFEPHVTLAYAPQGVSAEAVEPIVWRATEFVLIHSLLGQTCYIPLGRWPLLAA